MRAFFIGMLIAPSPRIHSYTPNQFQAIGNVCNGLTPHTYMSAWFIMEWLGQQTNCQQMSSWKMFFRKLDGYSEHSAVRAIHCVHAQSHYAYIIAYGSEKGFVMNDS